MIAPLSVALMNPWYWPEVRRGSERTLHDLAAELSDLGHRPRVLIAHDGPPRRTREDGAEVLRLPRPPDTLLRRRNVQPGSTHVPLSYAALRLTRPDVAHAFYPTDATAAVRWAERTGGVSVFSFMGVPTPEALSNYRGRLRALECATGRTDAVVALSTGARDALHRWFGVEAEVISPGVDTDAFRPGPGRAAEPTIACAADVTEPRKRVGLLVRAFARVRQERPTARLLLDAPADPAARAPFEAPGVVWRERGPDGMAPMFREAWASGLTSYAEAFGLVLVESLACGTPVFGAQEGGVPEIVDRPEIGALFSGEDEQDVARAMLSALELAEDPATATACRARAEDFTARRAAQAHVALYERLLAR
ncbi:MAG: glycosyltransferase family 4 protein [Solirubrobacterales bacterium]|nr:glycosyltransferase family 4 protein [Solirubrobacterales bacterium]